MQLSQRRQGHARRAKGHPGAGGRIERPRGHDDDHAGRRFDVNDLAAGAPLGVLAAQAPPIECVPAVTHFGFLPDMGRMTARFAVGRRNWTFAGSDRGGERAAAIYTLIETAKLNGIDPQAWLADVLARLPDHPAKRITDLLPWNWLAAMEASTAAPS